jgi:hypothetical protein
VINTRNGDNIEEPESDITAQVSSALKSVTSWPTNNLYSIYSGSASACAFSLGTSSAAVAIGGSSGTVTVADANYCAWLATSNQSWITVTSGALNSNAGSVGYTVAANTSGASRTGTITIAGLTYTITQAGPAATGTTLTVAPSSTTVGIPVTFTATVKKASGSGTPTGSVTFYYGSVSLENVALNNSGVATLTVPTSGLPPGSYPLTAKYSGDSDDAISTSTATSVTLAKAATATTLTYSPNPDTPPATITFTATVKRSASGATGAPTGSVTFYFGTTALSTGKLNGSGVATYSIGTTGFPAGSYPITATYTGDTSDNTSSGSVTAVLK